MPSGSQRKRQRPRAVPPRSPVADYLRRWKRGEGDGDEYARAAVLWYFIAQPELHDPGDADGIRGLMQTLIFAAHASGNPQFLEQMELTVKRGRELLGTLFVLRKRGPRPTLAGNYLNRLAAHLTPAVAARHLKQVREHCRSFLPDDILSELNLDSPNPERKDARLAGFAQRRARARRPPEEPIPGLDPKAER